MNAFALHDISDQAAVRRWGASAFAIVGRACGADRVGVELVHAAAGARRLPACDHGRHGAGFLRAAADADGSRAGTRHAAGRCLAAGARGCGSRAGTDRADAAAGEAGSRRPAGAEGGNEAGDRSPPSRSRRPSRRRSSRRWFARTRRSRPTRRLRRERRPRPRPSARRRPRPPPTPAHRRRPLPPTGRWSPPICNASSNTRPPPRPRASRAFAGQLHAQPKRCGAFRRPRRLAGHSALDAETLAMVRRAQPFPAFPADVKQSSMPFSAPVAFYIR